MFQKARNGACCKNNLRSCGCYAVAFGLGISLSCFCPTGLILFVAAVIITALGIMVIRH